MTPAKLADIRVLIATARVEAAAAVNGVQVVDLDEVIPMDHPRPEGVDDVAQVDPPGAATPAQNAYMPTRDIGAPQFVQAHPTDDGHGVKIGIVDLGST